MCSRPHAILAAWRLSQKLFPLLSSVGSRMLSPKQRSSEVPYNSVIVCRVLSITSKFTHVENTVEYNGQDFDVILTLCLQT